MKVGITGHQDLGSFENIAWISAAMSMVVDKTNIVYGFTCLAKGADQIYATIIRGKGIPYAAIIPCKYYELSFEAKEDLANFKDLLKTASEAIVRPFNEPSEVAYYEAGKFLVNCSDMLIAVWNGKSAKGLGGTADIVEYAITNGKKVININPISHELQEL